MSSYGLVSALEELAEGRPKCFPWGLLLALTLFRIFNSLLIQSHSDPDETWQSLEVAHNLVFGYGFLTWEWKTQIRSFVHPLLFAAVFWVLQKLSIDSPDMVIYCPRMLQALIAALTDTFTFLFARRLFGAKVAKWALFCQVTNWFVWYSSVRTISNSLEAMLTMMALCFWPLPTPALSLPKQTLKQQPISQNRQQQPHHHSQQPVDTSFNNHSSWKAVAIACVGCVVRPQSALLWTPLSVWYLIAVFKFSPISGVISLLMMMLTAAGVFSIVTAIDSYLYGSFTFPPLKFFIANVLENIGKFYGEHPAYWYVVCAWPVVMFTMLPLALCLSWLPPCSCCCDCEHKSLDVGGFDKAKVLPQQRCVMWGLAIVTLALSALAHKEFRFLLPCLSLGLVLSGRALHLLHAASTSPQTQHQHHQQQQQLKQQTQHQQKQNQQHLEHNNSKRTTTAKQCHQTHHHQQQRSAISPLTFRRLLTALILSNVLMGTYFGLVHQRGVLDVMTVLRQSPTCNPSHTNNKSNNKNNNSNNNMPCLDSVLFLMPCHSTPAYAYLHRNVSFRFLDCSPTNGVRGEVESDKFANDPAEFLKQFARDHNWEVSNRNNGNNTELDDVGSRNEMKSTLSKPSHIVLFSDTSDVLAHLLKQLGFHKFRTLFHSHTVSAEHDRYEFRNSVVVYVR